MKLVQYSTVNTDGLVMRPVVVLNMHQWVSSGGQGNMVAIL